MNGRPTSSCAVDPNEVVVWQVTSSLIRSSSDMGIKPISGSTNIFSRTPLRPTTPGPMQTTWQGRVNFDAADYAVYVYNIYWIKDDDGSDHTFDPIISIKPRRKIAVFTIVLIAVVSAIFTFKFLRKNLK